MDWLREAHADLHRRFSNSVRSKVASNRNRVEYKGHGSLACAHGRHAN